MTDLETRGKRIFLVLATLVAIEKFVLVGFTLAGDLTDVNWYKAVILPLVFVSMFAVMWQGENWVRWLMGAVLVFVGFSQTLANGYLLWILAMKTPPEGSEVFFLIGVPVGVLCLLGLIHSMIGLAILLLPSLQAFFRYQRERERF